VRRRGDERRKRCAAGKRAAMLRKIAGVRGEVFLLGRKGIVVCARLMADEDL
jgi:hypothetical protein